jgi:hypothetical protein
MKLKTSWIREKGRLEALVFVLFAVLFNLYFLRGEFQISEVPLNDEVLHLTAILGMEDFAHAGRNPIDFWAPWWALGYPFFHTYQFLPHLTVFALDAATFGFFRTVDILNFVNVFLIALFPLSIFLASRVFGFSLRAGGLAALASTFLSTRFWYGIEYGSTVWRGSGLFTQNFAAFFLPLALAYLFRCLTRPEGRGSFAAASILTAVTLLSHVIYGFMALVSIPVMVLMPGTGLPLHRRTARAALVLFVVLLLTSFFIVPMLRDGLYINHSRWESSWKWDSYGAGPIVKALFSGNVFDYLRLPVLTFLVFLGLGASFWKRTPENRLVRNLFFLWMVLFFGRATWGNLTKLLPATSDLHFHRLVGAVHLFGIFLIGLGGASLLSMLRLDSSTPRRVVAVILPFLILVPVIVERREYLEQNYAWGMENRAAYLAERGDLEKVVSIIKESPPGRVYPGLAASWGRDFKIGSTPMYAFLSLNRIDTLAFLFHSMSHTSDIMVHFDENSPFHYSLFNVRYVLSDAQKALPAWVKPLARAGRFVLSQVDASGGYFTLGDSRIAFDGKRETFYDISYRWMQSGLARNGEFITISPPRDSPFAVHLRPGETLPSEQSFQPEPRGAILAETVSPDRYEADVQAARPCLAVLKVTFHPGFKATVDNREQATTMVTPGFIAVEVPAGLHHVAFEYSAGTLKAVLLAISVATLLFLPFAPRVQRVVASRRDVAGDLVRRVESSPLFARCRRAIDAHRPAILFLPIVILAVSTPFFHGKLLAGHDTMEYLPRLIEFHENVRQGILLPRWAPDLANGGGQPIFVFNPPLFYMAAELFVLLGASFINAINLASLSFVIVAAIFMYLLGRQLYGPYGGLLASAACLLAPYFFCDLYVRHASAEFTAFPVYAMAFYAAILFARRPRPRRAAFLSLAVALLFLTHNPAVLMVFPFIIGWVILHGYLRGGLRRALTGTFFVGTGVALAGFFWIPALIEKKWITVSDLLAGYFSYSNHFVYLSQLFYHPWGFGISGEGKNDAMSFMLGIGQIALALSGCILCLKWPGRKTQSAAMAFLAVMLLLSAFMTMGDSNFIWKRLTALRYMAFPWRFLLPATFALCALAGSFAGFLERKFPRYAQTFTLLAIVGLGFANLRYAVPEKYLTPDMKEWTPSQIARRGIRVATMDEYMPLWAKGTVPRYAPEELEVMSGRARVRLLDHNADRSRFAVSAASLSTLKLNRNYYPGWEIHEGEKELPSKIDPRDGRLQFDLAPGDHLLEARLALTSWQWNGRVLSLAAIALLAFLPFLRQREH